MSDPTNAVARPSGRCPRQCLKCGRTFLSDGIHQRICRACKRVRSPDEVEPDERLDSEASCARRAQGLRRLMGLSLKRQGLARFFVGLGHRFETCQWIDGEPSADDSCKCGRFVRPGASYCDRHMERGRLHSQDCARSNAQHRSNDPSCDGRSRAEERQAA